MKITFYTFTFVLYSLTVVAQETSLDELAVVPAVNLERYSGTWYEIARLPNRFQSDCAGDVTATYTLDGDELIVVNRCRKENGEFTEAEGRARKANDNGPNSKLKVRFAPAFLSFLPFVWGNYWIIDLSPDYGYAVIGEPDRKYLWILARTKTLPETTTKEILERVKQQGYDVKDLILTEQTR
jgi:apolipoprotein D and lipocalin family protein